MKAGDKIEHDGQEYVAVHVTPAIDEQCDHEWVGENGGDDENPDHCTKCGLSFMRYIHCCCF